MCQTEASVRNKRKQGTEVRNPDGTVSADGLLSIASDAIHMYGRFAGGRMMEKLGVTNPAFLDNAYGLTYM